MMRSLLMGGILIAAYALIRMMVGRRNGMFGTMKMGRRMWRNMNFAGVTRSSRMLARVGRRFMRNMAG
ncbi:hypothetical protein [Aneurinibacillus terranovensis]|uniref:hypothetical protein n=1 Tax=Aneurinibacillus terranovensis TaxID=278991 RepID=UPI00041FB722|nr:hypothetical protein [Aneurinibacillus terranovensis]